MQQTKKQDIKLFINHSHLKIITFSTLALFFTYLTWVALHLKIDYYDSSLILLNANCIATGQIDNYTATRPIILPIVLSPIFAIGHAFNLSEFMWLLPHLVMIVFAVGLFVFVYRFYRLDLKPSFAVFGLFLLATNRTLIHMIPFCKEDVFAVFLLTTTFYLYFRSIQTHSWRYYLATGLLMAFTIGVRYNFPILFAVLALFEILSGQIQFCKSPKSLFLKIKDFQWKCLFLLLLPILLFALILSWHYSALGISSFWQAPKTYLTGPVARMAHLVQDLYPLPPIYVLIFLAKCSTWPVVCLSTIGLIISWRRRSQVSVFCALWLVVFLMPQLFTIPQKEARFLIAILPPFYYFSMRGLEFVWECCVKFYFENVKIFKIHALRFVLFLAILVMPISHALAELHQFRDPVYHQDFAQKIADYATKLAGGKQIYWVGPFYPVHPKNYIFHIEDVTYYIHHLGATGLKLLSNSPISELRNAQFVQPTTQHQPVMIGPNAGAVVSDGDVLVINPSNDSFFTKTLPTVLPPIYVERVQTTPFFRTKIAADGAALFLSPTADGSMIETQPTPRGFYLQGSGLKDGRYELYAQFSGMSQAASIGIFDIVAGQFKYLQPEIKQFQNPDSLFLLTYDAVRTFSLPRERT